MSNDVCGLYHCPSFMWCRRTMYVSFQAIRPHTSSSDSPFPLRSTHTLSNHLIFGLPLHLPGTYIPDALLPTQSSSLLMTCPYNLTILSWTFIYISSTSWILPLSVKRFERSNGLDTALYKTTFFLLSLSLYLIVYPVKLCDSTHPTYCYEPSTHPTYPAICPVQQCGLHFALALLSHSIYQVLSSNPLHSSILDNFRENISTTSYHTYQPSSAVRAPLCTSSSITQHISSTLFQPSALEHFR